MNKLLIICGPTATGKTSLALHLAKKFNGEVVSADSRQVFRYMDIGTGKDLPKSANLILSTIKVKDMYVGYYKIKGVKVWGYDLVNPDQEFSVSDFIKSTVKIVKDINRRKKLSILVGGTGLYIKGFIDGIDTAFIPKNNTFRRELEKKPTKKLFEILSTVDLTKAASMNVSDKANPRRLIRAIEIVDYKNRNKIKSMKRGNYNTFFVGLYSTLPNLRNIVKKRVLQRYKNGVLGELNELFKKGVTWNNQSMYALGYRLWKSYFDGIATKDEVLDDWISQEVKYAKRQMVWFKKDKRINWFDVSSAKLKLTVEKAIDKWYKINKED